MGAPAKVDLTPSDSGNPLPEAVQQKMEFSLGADFSNVRVHEGPQAKAIGALAFTQGNHLHFSPGQYNPNSSQGQELLGHELTHVVQQRAGRVAAPQGKNIPINADPSLEAEADRLGAKAAQGKPAQVEGVSTGVQKFTVSHPEPMQRHPAALAIQRRLNHGMFVAQFNSEASTNGRTSNSQMDQLRELIEAYNSEETPENLAKVRYCLENLPQSDNEKYPETLKKLRGNIAKEFIAKGWGGLDDSEDEGSQKKEKQSLKQSPDSSSTEESGKGLLIEDSLIKAIASLPEEGNFISVSSGSSKLLKFRVGKASGAQHHCLPRSLMQHKYGYADNEMSDEMVQQLRDKLKIEDGQIDLNDQRGHYLLDHLEISVQVVQLTKDGYQLWPKVFGQLGRLVYLLYTDAGGGHFTPLYPLGKTLSSSGGKPSKGSDSESSSEDENQQPKAEQKKLTKLRREKKELLKFIEKDSESSSEDPPKKYRRDKKKEPVGKKPTKLEREEKQTLILIEEDSEDAPEKHRRDKKKEPIEKKKKKPTKLRREDKETLKFSRTDLLTEEQKRKVDRRLQQEFAKYDKMRAFKRGEKREKKAIDLLAELLNDFDYAGKEADLDRYVVAAYDYHFKGKKEHKALSSEKSPSHLSLLGFLKGVWSLYESNKQLPKLHEIYGLYNELPSGDSVQASEKEQRANIRDFITLQKEHKKAGGNYGVQGAFGKGLPHELEDLKKLAKQEIDLESLPPLQKEYIQSLLSPGSMDTDLMLKIWTEAKNEKGGDPQKFAEAEKLAFAKRELKSGFFNFMPLEKRKGFPEEKQEKKLYTRIYINIHPKYVAEATKYIIEKFIHQPDKFPGIYDFKAAAPSSVRADSIVIYIKTQETLEAVINELRIYHQDHEEYFIPATPKATETVIFGVAVTNQGEVSFGDALSKAVLAALGNDPSSFEEFCTLARVSLAEQDIDFDNPAWKKGNAMKL